MRLAMLAASGLAAFALGAHAQPKAAPPAPQCFYETQIESTAPSADLKSIYVRVSGGRYYRLDLENDCPGLAVRDRIVLSQPGSTGSICGALDLNLHVRGMNCPIADLHQMTPAEVAAVPKKERP